MIVDYRHEILNQEFKTISGHYAVQQEVRLPFRGREILYVVGYAEVDTSCCGTGTITYALVAGFIVTWRDLKENGSIVSRVEPIRDQTLQAEIENLIRQREIVNQVDFR
jgi:hypothetical protein